MKKLLFILLAVIGLMSASFAEEAVPEDIPCYGTPTDTSKLLLMVNGTEETIIELRLKPVLAEELQENAELPDLLEEDSFPAGAKIGVWVEQQFLAEKDAAAPLFEIIFTFADNKVETLHNVPVADMDEMVICRDENVIWLTYTSLTTGEEISTWLDELNILAEQEAEDSSLEEDAGPDDITEDKDWNS